MLQTNYKCLETNKIRKVKKNKDFFTTMTRLWIKSCRTIILIKISLHYSRWNRCNHQGDIKEIDKLIEEF